MAENIERFARDTSEIARLLKLCRQHGVELVTLDEGEIGERDNDLKAVLHILYVPTLAEEIWRTAKGSSPENQPEIVQKIRDELDAGGNLEDVAWRAAGCPEKYGIDTPPFPLTKSKKDCRGECK